MPKILSDINISKEVEDVTNMITTLIKELTDVKHSRQEDMERLKEEKDEAIASIRLFKESLIEYLNKLEEKTKSNVERKFAKLETKINADIGVLGENIAPLENDLGLLQEPSTDDAKLFIRTKQSKGNRTNGNIILNEMKESPIHELIDFHIDRNIEDFVKTLKSLGYLMEGQPYRANFIEEYSIKTSEDKFSSRIFEMCALSDGSMLIVDRNNNCVKRFDESFKVTARTEFVDDPCGVCETQPGEAAMTLCASRKIKFLSVEPTALRPTRFFQ